MTTGLLYQYICDGGAFVRYILTVYPVYYGAYRNGKSLTRSIGAARTSATTGSRQHQELSECGAMHALFSSQ